MAEIKAENFEYKALQSTHKNADAYPKQQCLFLQIKPEMII